MKKMPLVLVSILTFTAIITFINAKENNPNRTEFSEFLTGTFTPGSMQQYGIWTSTSDEVTTGTADGDLVSSQLTFMLVANRRWMTEREKSFIDGTWKFVSASQGEISGIFNGKGTSPTVLYGKFIANEPDMNTGAFVNIKIQGEFSCSMTPLPPYGNLWRYEAWWNGTFQEVND